MEKLLADAEKLGLTDYFDELKALIQEKRNFLDQRIGNFGRFQQALDDIPRLKTSKVFLGTDAVTIGDANDVNEAQISQLLSSLKLMCPWRKGPFNLYGIDVDSEWQSWMKWDRLKPHISSLRFKKILDIGSSNGYYMFRMADHDPLMVLGVEPQSSFYYQYLTIQKLIEQKNVYCLPVGHERLPKFDHYFDMVFCMGVLYHRKSPIDMLKQIFDSLRPGGELVLENLVIDERKNLCLFPRDRYAKMRNVFFIPDLAAMESWLARAGFKNVRCVDVSQTTFEEQRKTDWIHTETLKDFLDPNNPEKTVEGYPAPVRAIFISTVPV